MVGQSLFLLADVKLLYVVYQLLLQSVLVVVGFGNVAQAIGDACAYLLDAALLVRLQAVEQLLDVVHLLGELLHQCFALLQAEVLQLCESLIDSLHGHLPLLVAELFHLGAGGHVGQPQQGLEPVRGFGNARSGRNVLYLSVVVLHESPVYGCGISAGILLNPQGEVHLSAFQSLGYALT